MIPLRLQLKNFLSYGAELQTIDFEPYQLICLSGKNGHGKSALLDAITWAIWGIARKQSGNSKADQGLLRLGQKQMMVIFDFIFNNQTYRIRREFALTHGKPYACLEFGILNQENDSVVPLTDKTIKTTQTKINKMLGLDYDAFTNSAFLRQGHANEFSKKSPKERKEILAQIIGLDRFEVVKKKAHETAREKLQKKSELSRFCERLEQELEKTTELKDKMTLVTKNLASSAAQEDALKQQRIALEKKKLKHINDAQSHALITQQLSQIKQEYTSLEQTFRTTAAQWRATHNQLLSLGNSDALQEEKIKLSTTISQYQKQLQESFSLKNELLLSGQEQQKIHNELTNKHTHIVSAKKTAIEIMHGKKKAIDQQRSAANKEYELLSKEITQLTLRIEGQQKTINATITEIKLATQEKEFEKKRSYYHKWIARANMLTQKKNELTRKKALSSHNEQPSCPLCEQNLSASRKRFLHAKFDNEYDFLTQQLHRLTHVLKELKITLIDEHAQLAISREIIKNNQLAHATLKELQKTQGSNTNKQKIHLQQLTTLEKESKKIDSEIEQNLKLLKKLSDTSSLTKGNKAYETVTQKMDKLSKKLALISVDEKIYNSTTKKLEAIEKQLASLQTVSAQKHAQKQRKEIVFTVAQKIKELTTSIGSHTANLKKFSSLDTDKKEITASAFTVEKKAQEITVAKAEMLQQKGRLEAQLTKLDQYKKEHTAQQKMIKQLSIEIDEYQIIATALGKDGIQALLIEDAIPEIEQEANDLLSKLTDNQSQIFIESLKDLKKGGTKETLDIKISDAAGIRPYEMFSGGESFRIDFALRIAISKLLARRAGTSLQTLIIDEGFGSQDEEGLAHIMEAIYKIQDDFSKVIIVSHLPAMKDQFPVHFVVEKTAQGSVVRVMEQG